MDSILLVEDEYALGMTLGDRLRKEGYVVDCAADGDEGFDKATQLPFDLIILDIMLPRRDGLDRVQRHPQVGRHHSGSDADGARPHARQSGWPENRR
jgi:two-component system OmpR family response regulator